MEDTLYKLFELRSEKYLNVNSLIRSNDNRSCRTQIEYEVAPNCYSVYTKVMEATIAEKSQDKLVVVFVDTKTKTAKIKKFVFCRQKYSF